jgi:hypothetical protein
MDGLTTGSITLSREVRHRSTNCPAIGRWSALARDNNNNKPSDFPLRQIGSCCPGETTELIGRSSFRALRGPTWACGWTREIH